MIPDAQVTLCTILEGGADVHRCAAARALGQIKAPGSVDALIKALLDEDSDVRTDAAEALLALDDPSAAKALMRSLLGDPEPDVKKGRLAGTDRVPGIRRFWICCASSPCRAARM